LNSRDAFCLVMRDYLLFKINLAYIPARIFIKNIAPERGGEVGGCVH